MPARGEARAAQHALLQLPFVSGDETRGGGGEERRGDAQQAKRRMDQSMAISDATREEDTATHRGRRGAKAGAKAEQRGGGRASQAAESATRERAPSHNLTRTQR